jgi:hypothetical protein
VICLDSGCTTLLDAMVSLTFMICLDSGWTTLLDTMVSLTFTSFVDNAPRRNGFDDIYIIRQLRVQYALVMHMFR